MTPTHGAAVTPRRGAGRAPTSEEATHTREPEGISPKSGGWIVAMEKGGSPCRGEDGCGTGERRCSPDGGGVGRLGSDGCASPPGEC